METKNVKIEKLLPAEYNPRQMTETEYNKIKKSIEENGFVVPIIANSAAARKNIVIGGHQRLVIAKDLGIKEVPVFYIGLTIEKEKELNLRLNKNSGEWEYQKLTENFDFEVLEELGFDNLLFSFSEDEIGIDDFDLDGGGKQTNDEMQFILAPEQKQYIDQQLGEIIDNEEIDPLNTMTKNEILAEAAYILIERKYNNEHSETDQN